MNKINNLSDLKSERIRLHNKKRFLEKEIENNFIQLKESISPSKLITNGASKMLVNKNYGLVNEIISLITDTVLKKVIFRNSGLLTRLIVPFLARNTANNLLQENKTKVLGWIGEFILKLGKKKNHVYDAATADSNI